MQTVFVKYLRSGATALALTLASGCAVQTTNTGKIQFSVDEAEVLGETLATFRTADGGEGRVRHLGGQYSVKLQKYLRVIPVLRATSVSFIGAPAMGQQTLLVLQKSERNCAVKSQIMSIQGSQVNGWDFGNCTSVPFISSDADGLHFDFAEGNRTVRYTYQNNKLLKGMLPAGGIARGAPASPSTAGAAIADGMPRYTPPLPVARGSGRRNPPAPALPPIKVTKVLEPAPSRPASKKRDTGGGSQPTLNFPQQEQKATMILILDK